MTGHNGTATAPTRQHASDGGASNGIFPALDGQSWGARILTLSRTRLGNALWHRRSVRAQLLITIVVIDFIAALVAGGVTIFQTRSSVQIEVAASMKLADLLVQEAIQTQQYASAERVLPGLPLQLRFLRHIRISVRDPAGQTVTEHPDSSDGARDEDRAAPPAWFTSLVASPAERHEFPVVVKGEQLGSVVVTGEPRDEIAEAWEHFAALGTVALALNAAVIGILYVLFGRVLDPIARLAGGLSDLERRNYNVRLPPQKSLNWPPSPIASMRSHKRSSRRGPKTSSSTIDWSRCRTMNGGPSHWSCMMRSGHVCSGSKRRQVQSRP